MSRVIFALILAACCPAFATNVKVGDTQKDAIAEMGRPTSIRQNATGSVWKFKDGTTLRLENGIVAEITPPGGKSSAEVAPAEPVIAPEDKPAVAAPPAPAPTPAAARPAARTAATPTSTSDARSTEKAKAAVPRSSATPAPTNRVATPTPTLNPVQGANVRASTTTRTGTPVAQIPAPPQSKIKRGFGIALLGVGFLLFAACKIMLLIVAFKAGVGWGLGCLFVPFVTLIFIITHWDDTKKLLLAQLLGGVPLLVVGSLMIG